MTLGQSSMCPAAFFRGRIPERELGLLSFSFRRRGGAVRRASWTVGSLKELFRVWNAPQRVTQPFEPHFARPSGATRFPDGWSLTSRVA